MMEYDFKDKVVVIAGGTGVLGRAVVDKFVEAGAKTVVSDRTLPKEGRGNPECEYLMLDALHEESVSQFFADLKARHGGVDIMVDVVGGYAAGQPVNELDLKVFEGQVELNLKSAFLLTKYAIRAMLEKGGGKIVLTASRAAVDKGENSFAYSVSKLGILRLVEAVATENRKHNININAILPSIIDTPANREAMPNAKHEIWPRPAQIARVIAFLVSEDAELISGAAIPVYGKA
jgi:NAD(P)-dependent dehydrogenase (short-subunit alcohol dehydrogenase family)